MRLAVSNIAWAADEAPAALAALVAGGAAGVEIAPSMVWPDWHGATPDAARALRGRLAGQGLAVPALQSILFGKPALRVFTDNAGQQALLAHIGFVAEIAAALGAGVMVFGSPRNRLRGALGVEQAMDAAVPVFRALGQLCHDSGTRLGIEANPAEYGGDFLLRWQEAAALVDRVDHPGIALHLDAACTVMAGDDPAAAAAACGAGLAHFHVSAQQLGPVDDASPIDHAGIAAALREAGYDGWVSVEMRRTETPIASVSRALACARRHYA